MEQHDLTRAVQCEAVDPRFDVTYHRQGEQTTDHAEQEIAEHDAARFRRRPERRQHAEQPAAEIGAEYEAQRNGERQHLQSGKRCEKKHDSEA